MDSALAKLLKLFLQEQAQLIMQQSERLNELISTGALANPNTEENPKAKKKRAKKQKDPLAPKASPSAYLLYIADKSEEFKRTHPDAKQKELMTQLGHMWSKEPADEKEKYKNQADTLRSAYIKNLEAYNQGKAVAPPIASSSGVTKIELPLSSKVVAAAANDSDDDDESSSDESDTSDQSIPTKHVVEVPPVVTKKGKVTIVVPAKTVVAQPQATSSKAKPTKIPPPTPTPAPAPAPVKAPVKAPVVVAAAAEGPANPIEGKKKSHKKRPLEETPAVVAAPSAPVVQEVVAATSEPEKKKKQKKHKKETPEDA